jgi:DNA topoisomerase-3
MMHEGTTSPPPLLTEADLIKLMDDNGIGTDATIAEHIHKIQKRNYIVPIGGFFEPTPLGEALVAGYNFIGFRKLNQPQLRAFMESEMKQISAGTKTKDEVIRQSVDMYKSIFEKVAREASKLDKALGRYFPPASESFSKEKRNFSLCGKCQSMMSYRVSDNGVRINFFS